MKAYKGLGVAALLASLAAGCVDTEGLNPQQPVAVRVPKPAVDKPAFLDGIIEKEGGTIPVILGCNNAEVLKQLLVSGQQLSWSYVLVVSTEKGVYTLTVQEKQEKPLVALATALEPGDVVRFRTNYFTGRRNADYVFSRDHFGTIQSNEIELLRRKSDVKAEVEEFER